MPESSTFQVSLFRGSLRGHGKDYKPFLTVRDVPSLGKASRPKGWKTGRVHQLLSTIELHYFYLLEWAPQVVDVREQYPLLPREETIEIAERLGIKHPTVPVTGELAVMTTDFLIDEDIGGKIYTKARAIKPAADLTSKRTIEKLEIERTYWTEHGIDWGIVTDDDIPISLARNVEWVHDCLPAELPLTVLEQVESALLGQFQQFPNMPFSHAALEIDRSLGQKPGTALWAVRHFIATKRWRVDMMAPILPDQPFAFAHPWE
jgi:hypothetical protein